MHYNDQYKTISESYINLNSANTLNQLLIQILDKYFNLTSWSYKNQRIIKYSKIYILQKYKADIPHFSS